MLAANREEIPAVTVATSSSLQCNENPFDKRKHLPCALNNNIPCTPDGTNYRVTTDIAIEFICTIQNGIRFSIAVSACNVNEDWF